MLVIPFHGGWQRNGVLVIWRKERLFLCRLCKKHKEETADHSQDQDCRETLYQLTSLEIPLIFRTGEGRSRFLGIHDAEVLCIETSADRSALKTPVLLLYSPVACSHQSHRDFWPSVANQLNFPLASICQSFPTEGSAMFLPRVRWWMVFWPFSGLGLPMRQRDAVVSVVWVKNEHHSI